MAVDYSELKAVLNKLEAADLPILEAALLPALLDLGVAALPAGDQAVGKLIEDAVMPVLQQGLASLLAKIQPLA